MRKAFLVAASALLAAACNTSFVAGAPIQASGTAGQRTFEVGGFEEIGIAGPFDAVVTVGGSPSVRAEGDTALLDHADIGVEGGKLRIRLREGFSWSGNRATVTITAPALNEADIAGSGDMRIGPFRSERFEGSIAGSGNLRIERLEAGEAEFDIAGSGNIEAAGTARQTRTEIAGSGNARLDGLQSETARVSIAGSGNAAVRAAATAMIEIAGSGNVAVQGGARCEISKVGSGDVTCG